MNKLIKILTLALILGAGCSIQAAATTTPATTTELPVIPSVTQSPIPHTETPTPGPEKPPDPGESEIWQRPSDSMMMFYIPAGEFIMGSEAEDPCAHLDEQPKHEVNLHPYWIDQTEVTNGQYQICVAEGFCPEPTACGVGEFTYQDPEKGQYPVTCLTWEEAGLYCEWVGGLLPTEAQWEKAARGIDYLKFPWGNEFDQSRCNSQESKLDGPMPVGSYSPEGDSPYSLQDMAGNVWEWTRDWYDIEYTAGLAAIIHLAQYQGKGAAYVGAAGMPITAACVPATAIMTCPTDAAQA